MKKNICYKVTFFIHKIRFIFCTFLIQGGGGPQIVPFFSFLRISPLKLISNNSCFQVKMGNGLSAETPAIPAAPEVDKNPGSMEDLHKKCKDVFPMAFEGYKFLVNKGLSQHFQVSHTLTLCNAAPSGYR